MMIKKPAGLARAHIPTDRVAVATNAKSLTTNDAKSNRTALTSFESVINSLRNAAPNNVNGNRPAKRHASPEFRAPKVPKCAARKLRRSRSVSDIESVLSLAQARNREAGSRFNNGLARIPAFKATLAPPTAKPKLIGAPKPKSIISKPTQSIPAHKKLVLNSQTTAAAKKDDAAKATKPVAARKIPPYDFKARFYDLLEKHKLLKEKHEQLKGQLGEFESLPEQYDECRAKLSDLESDYKTVQDELATLKQQNEGDQLKIKSLNDDLNAKIEECRAVTEARDQFKQQYSVATTEISTLKSHYSELETQLNEYKEMVEKQAQDLQDAADQLYRANIDRKDLHNTIMDLRGNIRVFCRVRPPLEGEENRTLCSWQHNDETSLEIGKLTLLYIP